MTLLISHQDMGEHEQDDSEVLVSVQGVSKRFCRNLKKSLWYGLKDISSEIIGRNFEHELRPDEFWAVNDVSFELRRGECLGLIGRNGAGKTTLLRMLNGLIKPDKGRIEMRGRVGALIALGAGFNSILTGRENIYVNASVLGLSKKEIDEKIEEIIDFAEIDDFIDSPVQTYSSGMQVRLGFAVATALNPDILILDEVLAVGDASFRSKCFKRLGSILTKCAVIFVSHDAYQVRRICDRAIWLKSGKPEYQGDVETTMEKYVEETFNQNDGNSSFINKADCISELVYQTEIRSRTEGDDEFFDIEVNLRFCSSENIVLGLSMANIATSDEVVVGQAVLKNSIPPTILKGYNSFAFCLQNTQLARGKYSLLLSIYDTTGKELVFNLRHICDIQVEGNIRYGPCYAISSKAIQPVEAL